jgi:hypothetical protein
MIDIDRTSVLRNDLETMTAASRPSLERKYDNTKFEQYFEEEGHEVHNSCRLMQNTRIYFMLYLDIRGTL